MRFIAAILFLLIFLPVLGAMAMSGKKALKFSGEMDVEQLLPTLVYMEIPEESAGEMIGAQAVLVRSRIYLRWEAADQKDEIYKELLEEGMEYERNHRMDKGLFSLCKEAVEDTRGYMLSYGGQVIEGPYCRASNGWTRGGKEVLGSDRYGWLVGVESREDLDYGAEEEPVWFSEQEMYELLKQQTGNEKLVQEGILDSVKVDAADSSGYALKVSAGGIQMSGESFRNALGLDSSSFTAQKNGDALVFTCRGKGHGMGLSQYGANQLADEGKSWRDILNHYFPNAQIIERNFV